MLDVKPSRQPSSSLVVAETDGRISFHRHRATPRLISIFCRVMLDWVGSSKREPSEIISAGVITRQSSFQVKLGHRFLPMSSSTSPKETSRN